MSPLDPAAAVAVIGRSARFPGAPDLEAFWRLLVEGREGLRRFDRAALLEAGWSPALVDDPAFVPVRGVLDEAEAFDAAHFGLRPAEADLTDPQHRVFLEACQSALDDAAIDPARFDGLIGVYGGCAENQYAAHLLRSAPAAILAAGALGWSIAHDKDHLVTRVAYKLGLQGPAMLVQSACSTGLVAIHQAAIALLSFQCDLALAGAAAVAVPLVGGHLHRPQDVYSPDGHTRPFDAAAAGTLSGDGVGVVVLRRLDEALAAGDPICAILRGVAVNNDGSRKLGYTAPSVEGQAACIRAAQALAGVEPADIGMVEAHGTATPLGDPMEVAALVSVFGVDGPPCALTAVKSNIGHTNAAAGLAGFLKATLAVERGTIPGTVHFDRLNPHIDPGPFVLLAQSQPWHGERIAAVSSFGAGGTNAHAILQAPPPPPALPADGPALLLISAPTEAGLDAQAAALSAAWAARPDLGAPAVAHTLDVGRRRFALRRVLAVEGRDDAIAALRDPQRGQTAAGGPRRLIFFCPAHGAQRLFMGSDWRARDPVFRETLHRCFAGFDARLDLDLAGTLYAAPAEAAAAALRLEDQRYAGPALFSLSVALAAAYAHQGLHPDAVVGHSVGEIAAAVIAGALDLEEAIALLSRRVRLIASTPPGGALHLPVDVQTAQSLCGPGVWVASHNGPRSTVVTGEIEPIRALADRLAAAGFVTRGVAISFAAHSPRMEPIAPALADFARQLGARQPTIPFYSGLVGGRETGALDGDWWARHLCAVTRVSAAISAAARETESVFLSLGPAGSERLIALSLPPATPCLHAIGEERGAADVFAGLWAAGVELPVTRRPAPAPRVSLPGIVFQRRRHWIDGRAPVAAPEAPQVRRSPRPNLGHPPLPPRNAVERAVLDIVEELLGLEGLGMEDALIALGADSLFTLRLVAAVEQRLGQTLPPSAAWTAFTPARLAALLPQAAPPVDRPSCLVPLRATGDRRPLFLVHPLAGVVFPYVPLTRALGEDQPVYALQAAGIDGEEAPDPTIPAMARRYVAALRAVQPRGPYLLAGYSFGSFVVYEMALQLEAVGEEVPLVALMDEAAPYDGNRPGLRTWVSLAMGPAGRSFVHHFRDYVRLGLKGDRGQLGQLLERTLLATLLPDEAQSLVMNRPAMLPLMALARIHWREALRYSPPGRAGEVVLFKSQHWEGESRVDRDRWGHRLGWERLARGGVHVVQVSGDHLGMIRDPHAVHLGAALRAAADRALAKTPSPR